MLQKKKYVVGRLTVNPRGFGFVQSKEYKQDIFIPPRFIKNGVDRDIVEVIIDQITSKGPEGRIVTILKRSRTHLAGIVRKKREDKYLVFVPLFGSMRSALLKSKKRLKIGDRVIMKVLQWNRLIKCELAKYLGNIKDASRDVVSAIEEFQLHDKFSNKAKMEAKLIGQEVSSKDLISREDLTSLNCITIDPSSAQDFDDAISISKDANGDFHLGVHITDVAHYIKPNTTLDKEAYLRCNSTYFPGRCIPMLPEAMANNLCSLKPDVIRLTISVLIDFDKKGVMKRYVILRSYIKSRKRFTYKSAKETLQQAREFSQDLKTMVELCHLLKKQRLKRGSIDFTLSDIQIHVDERGVPLRIEAIDYDIVHQLVEEFMLKANETVAIHLNKKGKMLIYRIHEHPESESFLDFFSLAKALGFKMPSNPTHLDVQKLFRKAKNTPYSSILSFSFIRSMKLAYYSSDNIGHYGLALEHYCHFTSPIRRYSDLVVERLLFDEEPSNIDLNKIASTCSLQERNSFQAECSVILMKKLRLLENCFKKDPYTHYLAAITRVTSYKIIFELTQFFIEGSIHVSDLEEDFFFFEPKKLRLCGKKTGKIFAFGDKIKVMLTKIDLICQETEWLLVETLAEKR